MGRYQHTSAQGLCAISETCAVGRSHKTRRLRRHKVGQASAAPSRCARPSRTSGAPCRPGSPCVTYADTSGESQHSGSGCLAPEHDAPVGRLPVWPHRGLHIESFQRWCVGKRLALDQQRGGRGTHQLDVLGIRQAGVLLHRFQDRRAPRHVGHGGCSSGGGMRASEGLQRAFATVSPSRTRAPFAVPLWGRPWRCRTRA